MGGNMDLFWGEHGHTTEDIISGKTVMPAGNIYRIGNEIFFSTEVYSASINKLIALVNEVAVDNKVVWGSKQKKEIIFHFHSYGGGIAQMFRFVDHIDYLKKAGYIESTTSIINNMAASAASIMAVSCDKRVGTKHCIVMVHSLSSSGGSGSMTELRAYAAFLEKLDKQIVEIYSNRTRLTKAEAEKMQVRNVWMCAQEALEKGFLDEIV